MPPFRTVPLTDAAYIFRMRELFPTFRMMTLRATPVWDVASQETPHTFRHSYAVHLLLNGIHIIQVQSLLGHQRLENTEIYTRIFALDLPADLTFSFPASVKSPE